MKIFGKFADAVRRYDETHNFTCDVCGREVFGGERVCKVCLTALPFNNGAICPFCGRKTGEEGACLECKDHPLGTDKARSVFTHEGDASRLVISYKRGKKYLSRTLADFLQPVIAKEFADADALAFVPMTKRAEKRRGYNQSRLLAEELSRRTGLECISAAEKKRETAAQKSLGRRERESNLSGCFVLTKGVSVRGRRIVIIDDTMTTGATAGELAGVLKRAGAERVYLATVTSVPQKNVFGAPADGKSGKSRKVEKNG